MENKIDLLGYNIYRNRLDCIPFHSIESKIVVNTINAYSYVIAKSDFHFKKSLQKSDVLLPDGFPIVLATRFLCGEKIKKIAGEDLYFHLMKIANQRSLKVFFLGSSENTLELINNRVKLEFPNVKAEFYSPPYKIVFSNEDSAAMINAVNAFKPDFLFVGMTAPKQEKWVTDNSMELAVKVICSIGAVFDFYAGTVKRPSPFWIKLRLEWFVRLVREPKRLWKRYFIYSPKIFIDVLAEKFKNGKSY